MGTKQTHSASGPSSWKRLVLRAFGHIPALSPRLAYDLWAPTYGQDQSNIFLQAEHQGMTGLMSDMDWSGTTVLDAGCGTGRYFRYCLQRGVKEIIGLDYSPGMLKRAKQTSAKDNISLVEGSVEAVPLRTGSLDVVLVPLVLGHVKSLANAAQELTRVARSGGTLLVSDWHPENERRGWRRTFEIQSTDQQSDRYAVEHHPHSAEEYIRSFTSAGCVLQRRLEPLIDDSMRAVFERNNMLPVYEEHRGSPLVLLLQFRKP